MRGVHPMFSSVLPCFTHNFHSKFALQAHLRNWSRPTFLLVNPTPSTEVQCQSSLARSFSSCRNLKKNCMNSFWFIVLYLSPSDIIWYMALKLSATVTAFCNYRNERYTILGKGLISNSNLWRRNGKRLLKVSLMSFRISSACARFNFRLRMRGNHSYNPTMVTRCHKKGNKNRSQVWSGWHSSTALAGGVISL